MTNSLTLFNVNGDDLRFGTTEDGTPYVVASDFAKSMGYRDADKATRLLDETEKGTQIVGTLGGDQEMSVIYEDGLWELIFRSSLPGAKAIKARVKQILREIRETGGYGSATPTLKNPVLNQVVQVALQLQATQDEQERLAAVQDQQGEQLSSLAAEVATVRALMPHMPSGSGHSIKELAHATGIPFLKMHEILRRRGITYRDQQKGGIKPYAEWITKGWAREELEQVRGVGATWVTYFTDSGLTEVKRRLSA